MGRHKAVSGIFMICIILFSNIGIAYCKDSSKNPDNNHVFYSKSSVQKRVALTFDDGPDNKYTPQILDILKKYNIKATFFVVGRRTVIYPSIIKRIIKEGHAIGNHTWDHQNLLKVSNKDALTEVSKTDEAIFSIAGIHTSLMRPPYGRTDSYVNKMMVSKGYNVILWSVDTRDWAGTSVPDIMKAVKNEIRPGGIILQHCSGNVANTVKALPQIITYLKEKGYTFVTVPELINVSQQKLEIKTTTGAIITSAPAITNFEAITGAGIDAAPPSVNNISYFSCNKVSVSFSEPIDIRTAAVTIMEKNDDKNSIQVKNIVYTNNNNDEIIIKTDNMKSNTSYMIEMKGFKDFAGNTLKEGTLFYFISPDDRMITLMMSKGLSSIGEN